METTNNGKIQELQKKLEYLEIKFGGLVKNIKRTNKSPLEPANYNTSHQGGDRMNSYHNYSKAYSEYLVKYIGTKINFVEIGILTGSGLAIWCDIFPDSNIYGFDIDISNYERNLQNLKDRGGFKQNIPTVHKFDQFMKNEDYLRTIFSNHRIDVAIDDGCHLDEAIIQTFHSIHPFLSENFTYFIEDNGSAYKKIKSLYPKYNYYYDKRMTVITP